MHHLARTQAARHHGRGKDGLGRRAGRRGSHLAPEKRQRYDRYGHEGVNGGNGGTPVTDHFSPGANLPHFMWGIDVSGDGNAFNAGATRLGFDVRQHPGEAWHFNVMTDPSSVLKRLDAV